MGDVTRLYICIYIYVYMKCMDRFLFLFFIVSLSRRLRKERRKEKFSRTVGCVAPLYATVTVPRTTFDRRRLFFRFDCRPCLSRKEKRRKEKRKKEKEKWFNSRQSSLLYCCGPTRRAFSFSRSRKPHKLLNLASHFERATKLPRTLEINGHRDRATPPSPRASFATELRVAEFFTLLSNIVRDISFSPRATEGFHIFRSLLFTFFPLLSFVHEHRFFVLPQTSRKIYIFDVSYKTIVRIKGELKFAWRGEIFFHFDEGRFVVVIKAYT